MYKSLLRPIMFSMDPEKGHHFAFSNAKLVRTLGLYGLLGRYTRVEDPRLKVKAFGLSFDNPIGLGAGFDKDCEILDMFYALGFGHIEAGTVTPEPQPGNPKPRLARFPASEALVNSMGFPSAGMETVAERFEQYRSSSAKLPVLGINIGKNKEVSAEDTPADYARVYQRLYDYADFFIVNVSSPNTPGLRDLQHSSYLSEIFSALQEQNKIKKPLLVKIAPDLSFEKIDDILKCCFDHNLSGIVAVNTTLNRHDIPGADRIAGGLSGKPHFARALEVVRYIYSSTEGRLPIIGVGGVSSGEDALAMIKNGASLVQMYTALIYQGPFVIKKINKFLLDYCLREGINSVSDLIGADHSGIKKTSQNS